MPKVQVYLPAALHARVKARASAINVSSVLQRALEDELAELERRGALDEALRRYQEEAGAFTDAELDAQEARDRAGARRPRKRGRGRAA